MRFGETEGMLLNQNWCRKYFWIGWETIVKDDFLVIGLGNCGAGGPISCRRTMWGTHRDAEMPLGKPNGEVKGQLGHLDTQVWRSEMTQGLEIQV